MYPARLQEVLPGVRERIAEAARRSGRSPEAVTVVAVTKGHPLSAVEAVLAQGITHLGENRVEGLEERVAKLGREGITWHMVGRLQSRKAGRAAEAADLIHSVDSLRLAERLGAAASSSRDGVARILVQVNTSGEESKSGLEPLAAMEAIREIGRVPGVRVEGLMTMAPFTEEEGVLRESFRGLRRLLEEGRGLDLPLGDTLSMGMSNDYVIAVEEGATMVRLGTVLFGERPA